MTNVDRILAVIDEVLGEQRTPPDNPRALPGRTPARTFTGRCPCWRCVVRRLPDAFVGALFVARMLPAAWREIGRPDPH